MNSFADMLWIELRKATRSRMPLGTALGSLFMPLGIAFLLFIARNPEISAKLGLVSAKANLITYADTDWPAYLGLTGQILAVGGFFFFVMAISWVFGREFADGTVKDLLAVPVPRPSILLAKFFVSALWSLALAALMILVGLVMGVLLRLPGGNSTIIVASSLKMLVITGLVIWGMLPFALFASLGRGYLLPLGLAIILVMAANLVVLLGWGDYFPWSVPMLYAQGESVLPALSYWSVILTGLAGLLATVLWWQNADQTR
jgi:ABC-2 type transport system permease protein